MILTLYLLKSILAMSILLVLYRLFLEKEKMHQFNRFYLLGAILLSVVVPFLPTGIALSGNIPTMTVESLTIPTQTAPLVLEDTKNESQLYVIQGVIFLYFIVFFYFCMKFGRNLFQLIKKVKNNEIKAYKGAKLVLLDDCPSPFTFCNYIFLSKSAYACNRIDQQLIDHELTHAQQRHSWDIIFIEFAMLIFWFNPVLRWFKTAIQLNHEFLADDSVIEQYDEIKKYQYLLLDTIQNNNKIYLASNINFHLTQKRLKMMTKKSSSLRKNLLVFSILPIVLILLMGLGNPVISQNQKTQLNSEIQGDPVSAKDKYFEHSIIHYKTEDGKTKIISYKSLDQNIKSKIPPPPPPPPPAPGSMRVEKEVNSLAKGTVVYLSEDGSIKIGNKKNGINIVPSSPTKMTKAKTEKMDKRLPFPPKPTMPPKSFTTTKAPVAPQTARPEGVIPPPPPPPAPAPPNSANGQLTSPTAVPAPPPPPPPETIESLVKEGVKFYIDGKEVPANKIQSLWDTKSDDIESVNIKKENDGEKSVYIKMK